MANELDYVDYSLENLITELTNRLKEKNSWKDTYRSSTGSMLIELFAAIGNLVTYYIERRAEESYIKTAKNKSSIVNLVRLLNYIPKRKVSSTGILRFTLTEGVHTLPVYIPKWTECQTSGGIKFLAQEDSVILKGQTYVDVDCTQGELLTVNYVSSGVLNAEFKINDTSVENTNLVVSVNGEVWSQVSSFIDSTPTSRHYVLKPELDDTLTIVFGNNVFGRAPDAGSSIVLQYIKSEGLDGNVYELGKITTINSTIYDSDSAIMALTVANTTVFLGGDAAESADEIRDEAPNVFATGDRAVTKSDFISIINNYAGVAESNAWGESEETNPDYDMYNQVKICLLLQEWVLADSNFKSNLSDYLYTKSLLTIRYSFVDPDIIYVIPILNVKVNKGKSLSNVESLITQALEAQFVLGDTTCFNEDKRLSDIVSVVEAIDGVNYSHVELKIKKELVQNYDSTHDFGEILDLTPIQKTLSDYILGIEVYINDTKVAVDTPSLGSDDIGNFTSLVGSSYTVTGDINYYTGVINIDIAETLLPTDVVSVRYKQEGLEGDIVVGKNQILKLDTIDITNISYVS